jgi:type II secretory pathway pseudopilin PulG
LFVELSGRTEGQQHDNSAVAAPRRAWFHRETISLAEIAVQVFSVVLGILLAFGIGSWNSSRESAHKVAEAQTAIRAEIQANRARLQQTVAYQGSLSKAVRDAMNSPTPPRHCTDVASWRGMQTALLLHSAYDNAIAAGVFTNMALADGQTIAAVYAWQQRYLVYSDKSLDWMVMKFMDESAGSAGCAGVLGDLSEAGRNLMTNYDAYLSSPSVATGSKSSASP